MTDPPFDSRPLSFKRGALVGAKLGLKVAFGFASFISVIFGIVALNPLVLLGTALYTLLIGLIPGLLVGAITGMFLAVVFNRLGDNLSERKIAAAGWAVGILAAIILITLIVWGTLGMNTSHLEFFEFIEAVEVFWSLLLCPAFITIFAIGWLARKIGGLE